MDHQENLLDESAEQIQEELNTLAGEARILKPGEMVVCCLSVKKIPPRAEWQMPVLDVFTEGRFEDLGLKMSLLQSSRGTIKTFIDQELRDKNSVMTTEEFYEKTRGSFDIIRCLPGAGDDTTDAITAVLGSIGLKYY